MSIHINFYNVDLQRFYNLVGSKDEKYAERVIFVVKSRLKRWHTFEEENIALCSRIVRQIIFEGKIPGQDYYQLIPSYNGSIIEILPREHSFTIEQCIMALLNLVGGEESPWLRYSDCIDIFNELQLRDNLSEEQTQLWNFLLKGRALLGETLTGGWWACNYGYFSGTELEHLLRSFRLLVKLTEEELLSEEEQFKKLDYKRYSYFKRSRDPRFRTPPPFLKHPLYSGVSNEATRLYNIFKTYTSGDLFFTVA